MTVAAVIPALAGAGATTVTLGLARAFAARGVAIELVDLDPLAELSIRVGMRPRPPLHDLFDLSSDAARSVESQELEPRIRVLPTTPGRFVGSGVVAVESTVRSAVDALRAPSGSSGASSGATVLIDTAPLGTPLVPIAAAVAEVVVVAVPAHLAGVRALPALLRVLLSAPTSPRLAAVVVGPVVGAAGRAAADGVREACAGLATVVSLDHVEEVARAALPPRSYVDRVEPIVDAIVRSSPEVTSTRSRAQSTAVRSEARR